MHKGIITYYICEPVGYNKNNKTRTVLVFKNWSINIFVVCEFFVFVLVGMVFIYTVLKSKCKTICCMWYSLFLDVTQRILLVVTIVSAQHTGAFFRGQAVEVISANRADAWQKATDATDLLTWQRFWQFYYLPWVCWHGNAFDSFSIFLGSVDMATLLTLLLSSLGLLTCSAFDSLSIFLGSVDMAALSTILVSSVGLLTWQRFWHFYYLPWVCWHGSAFDSFSILLGSVDMATLLRVLLSSVGLLTWQRFDSSQERMNRRHHHTQ